MFPAQLVPSKTFRGLTRGHRPIGRHPRSDSTTQGHVCKNFGILALISIDGFCCVEALYASLHRDKVKFSLLPCDRSLRHCNKVR